jgi:hypothetical protein
VKLKRLLFVIVILAGALGLSACDTDYDAADFLANQEAGAQEAVGAIHESVTIGAGTMWALDGMLSLPAEASAQNPVPAAVIVAGSGAHNMNGDILGVSPYRDMAEFLSQNGVAVIRHDKRNYVHGMALAEYFGGAFTVYEESIADAVMAAEILRADPRIDSNRIFVIGHSLGGMLAPRIHISGGDFAGLVLMAGSPRNLADIFIEQINADFEIVMAAVTPGDGVYEIAVAQWAVLEPMLKELALLQEALPQMTAEQAQAAPIPLLGASAYYLQDMMFNSFEDTIAQTHVPIYVLQGGRDFQITAHTDFAAIKELLEGRDNVTFSLFENLNHMFMTSRAANFREHAEEIMQATGQVDEEVLRSIALWIKSN